MRSPDAAPLSGIKAHVRRKLFEAQSTALAESEWMMSQILELYSVEYLAWLDGQEPLHRPKSPIGKAIRYTLEQCEALSVFVDNPKVRLDNNLSERNLRLIALGPKNSLLDGNDQGGPTSGKLNS